MDIFSEVSPPIVLLVFVFGTIIGSFLNVVVYRLGTGEKIGRSRSRCFLCGKTLTWRELIPLASFFMQKGKCRFCGSRISWQYPIVEFITGLVFLLVVLKLFNSQLAEVELPHIGFYFFAIFAYWSAIFSILIAISVYDFRHKIIPNQLVYLFIVLAFYAEVGFPHIMAGGGAFMFFASLWFFSKGTWMGFGDAKLALGMGFLLGPWLTTVAVTLSFWIGTLVAVPLALLRGGGLKTQIPFGPFLALGAFVSWLAGNSLLETYQRLLL